MRRFFVWATIVVLGLPQLANAACTKCIAKHITNTTDAAKYLFGGTDPGGGIGDWYLTNKKVEAIIDDIGTVDIDVVGGTVQVNKTSSNAVATGGTLVDVGLYKKNNDQLPQSFNVGGLSLDQVILFRQGDEIPWGGSGNPCASVEGSDPTCPADTGCASITTYGIGLFPNKSTQAAPTLRVKTRYQVCDGEQQIQMRTEIWNVFGGPVGPLPIIDVFLWGGRGLDAFVPAAGLGFNHPELDLGNPAAIITSSAYWFAPGNGTSKDGKMHRNKPGKEVSYGVLTGIGATPCCQDDPDGPSGGSPPAIIAGTQPNDQSGLHGNLLSATILPVLGGTIPNNSSRVFNRRLIVGKKNDGNSVTGDPKNPSNIFSQLGYPTGTLSGALSPGSKEEGTVTFIRTKACDALSSNPGAQCNINADCSGGSCVGGSTLAPPIGNNSPVTSVRTKGGFKVTLPDGPYMARIVVPGRDDLIGGPYIVSAGLNTPITLPTSSPKVGKITGTIVDADTMTGMPAKVSLSPSPVFHRDFEAMSFDSRAGMCSNDLNNPAGCVVDGDCGGSNTCFRTCSNKQPTVCVTTGDCTGTEVCATDKRCRSHACSSDLPPDCEAGNKCVANTASIGAEGFPGGAAQLNVIYTANGVINQPIKPGSYTVTVSRGLEWSIQRYPVTVPANGEGQINGGSPVTLKHVVDSTGWTSADFHIHSGRSLDSSVPLEARVRSFAAEGVDVMVATDHDMVTDYNPAIDKMKLRSSIGSIVGTEITTSVGVPPYFSNAWGHMNGWPQLFDPDRRRSNSIEDENVNANVIHDRIRASLAATSNKQCIGGSKGGRGCTSSTDCKGGGTCSDVGTPVVQLNHVRAGLSGVTNIGYFDNIGYNPAAPITDCQKYPQICPTSHCFNGSNDGTACTTSATCTGGGVCGCVSGSVPAVANGCNAQLLDLNVVPQAALCTTAGCGGGFEAASGTRGIDADMMEVDNGGNASGWGSTKEMRRDWLSLVNQNVQVGKVGSRHPMWSTGVSDSHRLVAELPGYSRTFVKAGDLPNPTINLDIKGFNQKVLDGKMYSTTGPVFDVDADNGSTTADLGDTLDASGGTVNLNITVRAAPWIPIDEVRIIKNGCVIACFNSSTVPAVSAQPAFNDQTAAGVVRFNASIPDTVSGDSYYVIEASPDLPASGNPAVDADVNSVAAGMFPFGYTNPIFADFDGGGYTGIGAPEPVCGALPASCSAGSAVVSIAGPTMVAKSEVSKELSLVDRILALLVPSATAHEAEERPENEAERLRQHEETIRKQGPEYFPRQFFVIPTPAPAPQEEKKADQ